ncbi:hypothetical protein KAR91_10620 [Candidatus Pacearchaeota archaeon]|nr:hypothetical protein [Candidatus Pacearchaeota archaeon]
MGAIVSLTTKEGTFIEKAYIAQDVSISRRNDGAVMEIFVWNSYADYVAKKVCLRVFGRKEHLNLSIQKDSKLFQDNFTNSILSGLNINAPLQGYEILKTIDGTSDTYKFVGEDGETIEQSWTMFAGIDLTSMKGSFSQDQIDAADSNGLVDPEEADKLFNETTLTDQIFTSGEWVDE